MSDFGTLLEQYRVARGMTQRKLAALSGIESSQLSRIERGHRWPPSPERFLRLCDVLRLNRREMLRLGGLGDYQRSVLESQPAADSDVGVIAQQIRLTEEHLKVVLADLATLRSLVHTVREP